MTILLAVYDGNDNLVMRFMYADARAPLAMTKGGLNYYLCYDQVGSLRLVTDTFGNVVKEIDYDSFGNVLADSDASFTVPFGFAGGLCDVDTGLVHFGARDYDPDTGMWTAKDPILFKGADTNLYGYCLADPVNLVDSDGRIVAQIIGGLIGAGFGAYSAYASGKDLGQIIQSGLVGGAAGVLSTIPIPGINPLFSGVIMGVGAGFLGNVGTQLALKGPCIDWMSAFGSAIAGGVGGLVGSGIAGIQGQGFPIFTEFGQEVNSSSAAGIVGGGVDVLLHSLP